MVRQLNRGINSQWNIANTRMRLFPTVGEGETERTVCNAHFWYLGGIGGQGLQ